MILTLYRALTTLAGPVFLMVLDKRMQAGKEDPVRFRERQGEPGLPRPNGPVAWVHAASVGESLAMLTLVDRLRADYPDIHVLVTTGTVTSAGLMAERLPDGAFHQFAPVDRAPWVRKFLDHWRPGLALWAESEFWPNMLNETASRGAPLVLVNGRMSPRSFDKWRKAPWLIRRLLSEFTMCLGQTEGDVERLVALGAPHAKYLGNLKYAAPPLPADDGEVSRMKKTLADRPRWLAASTHAGEEDIAGRVHARLEAAHQGLLTMIVPRHPERGPDVAKGLRAAGLSVALRSAGEKLKPDTQIYVADTMGELGLFFRLAGIVFMGKSLVSGGGQNPLEPARLDCAVLFGPLMANFEDMARRMKADGAAREAADESALADAVSELLTSPEKRRTLSEAAARFAEGETGMLDRVMSALEPHLAAMRRDARDARP